MPRISKAHWDVLSPLLDELLDSNIELRALRLAEIRRSDERLADDLSALLVEHGDVEREAFLQGDAIHSRDAATLQGQIIGSYTLGASVRPGWHGHRLARPPQRWPVRRSGRDQVPESRAARRGAARFQREGNILARLAHPHIGRLLDAGVAADGQPYLVLEFVEGVPIDRWCDTSMLDVPARIRLFLDVPGAVAEAHRNLIVHRDLKPSNILVTAERTGEAAGFRHRQAARRGSAGRKQGLRAHARRWARP